MQCLPGYDLITVFNKLLVFCVGSTSQDLISAITFVIEERMAQKAHVGTDLMSTPSFKYALNQGDISITFQHLVMGDGMFSNAAIQINHHLSTVFGTATDMTGHGSFLFGHITPDQCNVFPVDGVIKEFPGQSGLG